MFECTYCDLTFNEKKLFSAHQKTKRCLNHRYLGFTCKKCLKSITGYDNALNHTTNCDEPESTQPTDKLIKVINQLAEHFKMTINFENGLDEGTITFQKTVVYKHPSILTHGIPIAAKPTLFYKTLEKLSIDNADSIIGSHNLYLNDMHHKILRLNDSFQHLGAKCNFEELCKILWLNSPTSCFQLYENRVYILDKVQCQNQNGQKWYGDTFTLTPGETIVKCVWHADPYLKQFYKKLSVLIKDLLNLYLVLGNWCLKKKKIKIVSLDECDAVLSDVMEEFHNTNLVTNLKLFSLYESFFPRFKQLLVKWLRPNKYSNIEYIYKDEAIPFFEDISLMELVDPSLTGGNYYYLMYYILPDYEKPIFLSKHK